jgi:hypothetical protein
MNGIVKMRLLIAGLALVGCGGGGSSSPAGQFVGTWAYTSGQLQVAYPGRTADTSYVAGNLTITRSTTSDLLYSSYANGTTCAFTFSTRGSIPVLLAGSSCTATYTDDQTGYPYTFTMLPTSWSLQVNGGYMAEHGVGNCSSVEQGVTTTCTFSQTGDLTKI